MAITQGRYSTGFSLREKILYVLRLMDKGSANEMSAEITELDSIASEEGVAELAIDIENELERMVEEGLVRELKEHRQKKRYVPADHPD